MAFLLIAISLVLLKFAIYDPVTAAQRHEATIAFSLHNAVFGVFAFLLGTMLVIVSFLSPDAVATLNRWGTNPETKRINPKAIAFAAVLTIVSFAVAFWVQTTIHNYGYDV